MWGWVGGCVHLTAGAPKDQRCWVPLELEFTDSCEVPNGGARTGTWVLGKSNKHFLLLSCLFNPDLFSL